MTKLKIVPMLVIAAMGLAACDGGYPSDKTIDRGFVDSKDLSQLQAGIWVDPNGCDHWIIDDGLCQPVWINTGVRCVPVWLSQLRLWATLNRARMYAIRIKRLTRCKSEVGAMHTLRPFCV